MACIKYLEGKIELTKKRAGYKDVTTSFTGSVSVAADCLQPMTLNPKLP